MCNYCEPKNDGTRFAHIAGDSNRAIDPNGFRIQLDEDRQNNYTYDKERNCIVRSDSVTTIIRAFTWDNKNSEWNRHLDFQIHYCPFCGEKLDS